MRYLKISSNIGLLVLITLALVTSLATYTHAQNVHVGQLMEGGVVIHVDWPGNCGVVAARKDLPDKYDWNEAQKAGAAFSITVDGKTYDDWFLPNKFIQNTFIAPQATHIGGFDNGYYWSSSDGGSAYYGKGRYLGHFAPPPGPMGGIDKHKTEKASVRLIRAFGANYTPPWGYGAGTPK